MRVSWHNLLYYSCRFISFYFPHALFSFAPCTLWLCQINNFEVEVEVGLILLSVYVNQCVNTLRSRQNGPHFPDDIFKWIFLNENVWISINISLKFVPMDPINNIPTLVQVMAWRRPGDKPLSELMMVRLPTHICVTRPQWVKCSNRTKFECSSLKNGLRNYQNVKISNWVSMHIFDELQDPLPVSWIGHTGRIISVKLKLVPGGGTLSENCWGCAVGHWKLDPKRSRGKWYFGAKKIEFCEDLYLKDRFCVGGWEKNTPKR